jgi:hypothetical protein
MSEQLNYKVNVDTNQAVDNVDNLNNSLNKTSKTTQQAQKNAKATVGAFSSIGSTLKTLGVVSIVSKGFEFFTQILGKNQKVVDFVSTSVNFLTGVFSDLVSFLVGNVGKVTDFFKDVFENPTKYVEQLSTAIKDNLIERVKSLIDAFGFLGSIIKNVFTGNFDAAQQAAKDFGKEVVDIFTGVDDAFDKSAKAINELTDAASEYFTKKIEQAKDLTAATNNAVIAEARMLNTIKQTEIAAERLRQKRDDETLSIQDRIKANDELLEVLKSGQKQELSLVAIKEAKVKAEIALNGTNKELQAELIRLAGERADVEEKYTAFASEGLTNRNALLKEQIDIAKSLAENENKLGLDRQKASSDLIKDEIEKLEVKKRILEEETKLELQRLQDNINNTKEGTTARAEAEIAFSQKKNELAIQGEALDNQIQQAQFKRNTDALERLVNDQNLEFAFRQEALNKEQQQLDEALLNRLISQDEYNVKYKELSDKRLAIDAEELAAQQALQDRKNALINAGLNFLQAATGENERIANIIFTIQKALEIGRIISSTASAIAQVNAGVAAVPAVLPPGIPNPAFPAAVGLGVKKVVGLKVGAAAQIGEIAGATIAKFKGASTASVGGSAPVSASAPLTPQRPETQTTNLSAQTINAIGNQAIRAYVVETDITSNQKRVQAIKQRARFS